MDRSSSEQGDLHEAAFLGHDSLASTSSPSSHGLPVRPTTASPGSRERTSSAEPDKVIEQHHNNGNGKLLQVHQADTDVLCHNHNIQVNPHVKCLPMQNLLSLPCSIEYACHGDCQWVHCIRTCFKDCHACLARSQHLLSAIQCDHCLLTCCTDKEAVPKSRGCSEKQGTPQAADTSHER